MLAGGARVRYTGCYLRYETFIFYNGVVEGSQDYEWPPHCTGSSNDSSALYQQNLRTALQNSAAAAPERKLSGYSGASSVGSGSNTAYALTQCLGYLNSSQCATCLSQLVSNFSSVCNRSVSGEVYLYTCYYLFSNTSFLFTYNNSGSSPSQAPATRAIDTSPERSKNHTPTIVGVVVGVCLLLAIIAALALCFLKRREKEGNSSEIDKSQDLLVLADQQRLTDERGARRFSLKELQDATDNFHANNKLGEGGFGPVYQRSSCPMRTNMRRFVLLCVSRWNSYSSPLHSAAFMVDPEFQGSGQESDKEVSDGWRCILERLALDADVRHKIRDQLSAYRAFRGSFGCADAQEDRFRIGGALWWEDFGSEGPELQRVAIYILSQAMSSSCLEQLWSSYSHVASKKRNRLGVEKANDLVFISANLRMLCKGATAKADPFTQWEMEQEEGHGQPSSAAEESIEDGTTSHDHEASTSHAD